MAVWWPSHRPRTTENDSTRPRSAPADAPEAASPPDRDLSPGEFAVLAYLAAVPGGAATAACAKALRLDTAQVADLLTGLSARGFTIQGRDAHTSAITDQGRRAFTHAQAPCCGLFKR